MPAKNTLKTMTSLPEQILTQMQVSSHQQQLTAPASQGYTRPSYDETQLSLSRQIDVTAPVDASRNNHQPFSMAQNDNHTTLPTNHSESASLLAPEDRGASKTRMD